MADISEECAERLRTIERELSILERVLHPELPKSLIDGIPKNYAQILHLNILSSVREEIQNGSDTDCSEILRELEPFVTSIKEYVTVGANPYDTLRLISSVRDIVSEALPGRPIYG